MVPILFSRKKRIMADTSTLGILFSQPLDSVWHRLFSLSLCHFLRRAFGKTGLEEEKRFFISFISIRLGSWHGTVGGNAFLASSQVFERFGLRGGEGWRAEGDGFSVFYSLFHKTELPCKLSSLNWKNTGVLGKAIREARVTHSSLACETRSVLASCLQKTKPVLQVISFEERLQAWYLFPPDHNSLKNGWDSYN